MTTIDKIGSTAIPFPIAVGLIVLAARVCGLLSHLVESFLGSTLM
jgi:hypothetical protein